jgi:aminopeptidase N
MHKFKIVLLIIACAYLVMTKAQQTGNIKKLPPLQSMRVPLADVKHIALDLRFDWKKKQAFGTAGITLSPLSTTDKIYLDAGMLTINSITLSAGTPLKFNYDGGDKNDGLEVILDRVYQALEEVKIKIDYHTNYVNDIDPNNLGGSNGKGIRFSKPASNDPDVPWEIYSMGEPEGNRYWFPCYDAPNDLRTTELTATVDKKLTAISNGTLIETKDNADGTYSFHYKMDKPYANHLTSFVVGEYYDVKQLYGNIQLHNYGYKSEKEATTATTVRLPDMIKYFSETTGLKYPYPSYSQAFVQDLPNWSGNSTASTITENMVDDQGTHADFFYLWDLTEAEVLAYQWFGNAINTEDWSEVWLTKSFSHYFNELYDEHKNGRDEMLHYVLAADHTAYLGDWANVNRHPIVTKNYENLSSFVSDNYAYGHGAEVLHMLRKHLGEKTWWQAIKLYVKTNTGKLVTTQDFIKAVNNVSKEPMDWFFDQWIYKMGHPVFEVTKKYDERKRQLQITVKQRQTTDTKNEYPQVQFFKGKIDVETDTKIETVWLEAKEENVYTFNLLQNPKLVNFDFESTWIKEMTFKKSLDELLYQLENDKDILGKQRALNEIIAIAAADKTTATSKEKIKAVYRKVIMSNSYWRIRVAVLGALRGLMVTAPDKSVVLDDETKKMLLKLIKTEKSWLKASLISCLGAARDIKYVSIYLTALNDKSDRVIAAAAAALGKTKSPKAFPALEKLVSKPSMKSQSLLCALAGLKELGDARGFDIAYKVLVNPNLLRWRLPTGSVWDYRVVAANNIAALKRGKDAYPVIFDRFKNAMEEEDINGIFNNVLLISILADSRGQEVFDLLKTKFKDDANAMNAVNTYETQFKTAIKK